MAKFHCLYLSDGVSDQKNIMGSVKSYNIGVVTSRIPTKSEKRAFANVSV